MSPDGQWWDLYGKYAYAFEDDTSLTYDEVKAIVNRRKQMADKEKEEALTRLETKWA